MTQNELKNLVKEYFNLTEIKFGELYDENKAFKIVFEGDQLELGMPVKVVTTDGQEMDAPDGFHKLENGMVIKTEGSKVVEITTAAELAEEETLDGGKVIEKVEMAEVKTPDVVEQFPVEVQRGAEYEKPIAQQMESEEDVMSEKTIVEAVAKAIAEQLTEMKKEMAAMKDKMEKMSAEPAAAKTLPTEKKSFSLETSSSTPVDAVRYEMMKQIIKTHKK